MLDNLPTTEHERADEMLGPLNVNRVIANVSTIGYHPKEEEVSDVTPNILPTKAPSINTEEAKLSYAENKPKSQGVSIIYLGRIKA